MLPSRLSSRKIYRLRPGVTTDYYGDPIESWDAPQKDRLRGAQVQDVSTVEEDGVVTRVLRGERLLVIPGRADLLATDRVEVDGKVWRVNGDPAIRPALASGVYTSASLSRSSDALTR